MYGKIIKVYSRYDEPDFIVECPKCGNQEAYISDGDLALCFVDTDISTCVKCECEYRLKKIDILRSLLDSGLYPEDGLAPSGKA